jgi:hypothetical protein
MTGSDLSCLWSSPHSLGKDQTMRIFDQAYIDGAFRPVLGREELTLVDPTSEVETGRLRLADAQDAKLAVDAASRALPLWAASSKAERIDLLNALAEAVEARADVLTQATIEEYGGPVEQARWRAGLAAANFRIAAGLLADFPSPGGSTRPRWWPSLSAWRCISCRGTASTMQSASSWPGRWPPVARWWSSPASSARGRSRCCPNASTPPAPRRASSMW